MATPNEDEIVENVTQDMTALTPETREALIRKLPIGSLCAFSDHPRVFCAWDVEAKRMYAPQELASLGAVLTPDGKIKFVGVPMNLVIRWFTGHIDMNNRMIFEGDILQADITNEFGSAEKTHMIAVWDTSYAGFIMKLKQSLIGKKVPVTNVLHVGNEIENPELLEHFKT